MLLSNRFVINILKVNLDVKHKPENLFRVFIHELNRLFVQWTLVYEHCTEMTDRGKEKLLIW